jgi:hypothetical protein
MRNKIIGLLLLLSVVGCTKTEKPLENMGQKQTLTAPEVVTTEGSIIWKRGEEVLAEFGLPADPVKAGERVRFAMDLARSQVKQTDVMVCKGKVDFGRYYAFKFPACTFSAEKIGDAHWYHHCMIDATKGPDGTVSKGLATPGFIWPEWLKFERFQLSAPCAVSSEDGCVGGYSGDTATYPAYASYLEFDGCLIDCYQTADWGFAYTWAPYVKREIIVKNCNVSYCRFGIACASSNQPLQFITCEDTTFIGDARQSKSTGETSGGDSSPTKLDRDENGGVLAAVLCRSGTVVLRRCRFKATGLEAEYYDTKPGATYQRWGCSRIANWGTDKYNSAPSQTTWTFEKCASDGITQNISHVWNDVDVRGTKSIVTITGDPAAVKAAAEAGTALVREAEAKALDMYRISRGGSGIPTGDVLQWKAPPAPVAPTN